MATREENLKKINDELEKLDDEELEKVAGGFGPHPHLLKQNPNADTDLNQPSVQKAVPWL